MAKDQEQSGVGMRMLQREMDFLPWAVNKQTALSIVMYEGAEPESYEGSPPMVLPYGNFLRLSDYVMRTKAIGPQPETWEHAASVRIPLRNVQLLYDALGKMLELSEDELTDREKFVDLGII